LLFAFFVDLDHFLTLQISRFPRVWGRSDHTNL